MNAILNGKEQEALSSITYALTEDWDLLSIYSELISESIRNIGDMWHRNEITISHEHRASQITLNILTYLRNNLVKTPISAPLAIVSTIEGDMELSIRFPGSIALAILPTSPYALGIPGFDEKSSISLLSRKPAPSTTIPFPNQPLIVVVTLTALPHLSTTE